MESNEELSEEELKKKAYLISARLKNSGLDDEAVYARLEKQGIPEEIAQQVMKDTLIERKREVIKEAEPIYNFALFRIGVGIVVALLSYLIFPNNVILPIGIIAGGVISALLAKKKMEE